MQNPSVNENDLNHNLARLAARRAVEAEMSQLRKTKERRPGNRVVLTCDTCNEGSAQRKTLYKVGDGYRCADHRGVSAGG